MDTATLANEFKLVFVEAVFVVCGAVCSPDVNLYIPFMSEFSQRNYWFLFYLRVSFPNTFSDICWSLSVDGVFGKYQVVMMVKTNRIPAGAGD